jgi:UDP-N-acetylglucosamine transferase subunit ALG13
LKNIRRGKDLWKLVRQKRMVISAMAHMGEGAVLDLDRDRIMSNQEKEKEEMSNQKMSKLIMYPDNFWKMHFDN